MQICFNLTTNEERACGTSNNSRAAFCMHLCMVNFPNLVTGVVESGFVVDIHV